MTKTTVDAATGNLLVRGKRVFPLGLSDGPPVGSTAPNGRDAWAEIASAGVGFVRNYTVWTKAAADEQLIAVGAELDAAKQHGLQLWLALAGIDANLSHQALLDRIVNTLKPHPGLGIWKGVDEPAHAQVPPAGCVAVYKHLRAIDPDHPVVIIEAPRQPGSRLTVAAVRPYSAACDIHGVDIYPLPPGAHAGHAPVNTDISVVGDVTRIIVDATGRKGIWTTLQIAWTGTIPPHPRLFPTLQQARFMAYDAIIAGARGLFFFGGHIKPVMTPADRRRGWNWTHWENVQRPLLLELTDAAHKPMLTARLSSRAIKASAADIALSAREAGGYLYVIAARKSATANGDVRFTGLPIGIGTGTVLGHGESNPARRVTVKGGAFTDPSAYAPHNARVYRFKLPIR